MLFKGPLSFMMHVLRLHIDLGQPEDEASLYVVLVATLKSFSFLFCDIFWRSLLFIYSKFQTQSMLV